MLEPSRFLTAMDTLTLYLPASSVSRLTAGFSALALLYALTLATYRLVFSSLAGFPGPKLAAMTDLYEFYFDFFRNGTYIFEIEKMHQKYGSCFGRDLRCCLDGSKTYDLSHTGPIVRVNPYELSIHDQSFYNDLYVAENTRRTDNYNKFGKGIDFDG